jgi:hypothetical protein
MPSSTSSLNHLAAGSGAPRHAYQSTPPSSDRAQRCNNRNGIWPPLYKRQWNPHPPRSLPNTAQAEWQRCVLDAVAAGELHRTTGAVLLAFSRRSSNRHEDVWIAQATVGEHVGLAASTVCHHVAAAKRAGWLAVQHRNRIDNGFVTGMSNLTRFELPAHWRNKLDEQRRERDAARTRERRSRPGRTTGGHNDRRRAEQPRPMATPATHAASAGAAVARTAASFEDGRLQLENEYRGRADLYEAAYDSFVEIWKKVRLNE